jgi:hypothetical protein
MRDIAPAQQAGMSTFLAEQWIANPDPTIVADRTGTLVDLIEWISQK